MFYIKENLNDTTSISVEINNENVYCHCSQKRLKGVLHESV